jgi:hypothetical protein
MKNHFYIIILLLIIFSCNLEVKKEDKVVYISSDELRKIDSIKRLPENKKAFLDFVLGNPIEDSKILNRYYIEKGVFSSKDYGIHHSLYQISDLDSKPINVGVSLHSMDGKNLTSIQLDIIDVDSLFLTSVIDGYPNKYPSPSVHGINSVIELYTKKYGNPYKMKIYQYGKGSKFINSEDIDYNYYKWMTNEKMIYLRCYGEIPDGEFIVKEKCRYKYKNRHYSYQSYDSECFDWVHRWAGYGSATITYTTEEFDKLRIKKEIDEKVKESDHEIKQKRYQQDTILKKI